MTATHVLLLTLVSLSVVSSLLPPCPSAKRQTAVCETRAKKMRDKVSSPVVQHLDPVDRTKAEILITCCTNAFLMDCAVKSGLSSYNKTIANQYRQVMRGQLLWNQTLGSASTSELTFNCSSYEFVNGSSSLSECDLLVKELLNDEKDLPSDGLIVGSILGCLLLVGTIEVVGFLIYLKIGKIQAARKAAKTPTPAAVSPAAPSPASPSPSPATTGTPAAAPAVVTTHTSPPVTPAYPTPANTAPATPVVHATNTQPPQPQQKQTS